MHRGRLHKALEILRVIHEYNLPEYVLPEGLKKEKGWFRQNWIFTEVNLVWRNDKPILDHLVNNPNPLLKCWRGSKSVFYKLTELGTDTVKKYLGIREALGLSEKG